MLDQTTKRKIDNARDILVGKVPDPKSQVEQITIALIYKFMDDMDKESEEMGGKATFFTGEYEKYAWSRIFDPRLGGFDLINTYSEAIIKMNHNPKIPQLFRDIFKNAYLPYRDPETLKSFLKEINEFHYDHSERLGDAFEYLLSVLGSQGEAGQFRTPRHIIDFIVSVVDPKKNDTIADPACGTAGFLISSYKHILKQNTSADSPLERGGSAEQKRGVSGDKLTPDERKRLLNNLVGYDISPDMVRLSLVNMYLHEFPDPKIHEYDTLTSEERWNETFDVILANPPFMTPKGGIRPHKRFSVQAKKSEVLFVDYIAEHLNPNGRAGVIVPEGIMYVEQKAYKEVRKYLVEDDNLFIVVSLPYGMFKPYASVKTYILIMDKTLAKKSDYILFVDIVSDGYTQTDTRLPVEENDIPDSLQIINTFKKHISNNSDRPFTYDSKNAVLVRKEEILSQQGVHLIGRWYNLKNKYPKDEDELYPFDEIGNICDSYDGESPNMKTKQGKYPFVIPANYRKTADHYTFDAKAVCVPLVSSSGHGKADIKRLHYQEGKFALADTMCCLIPKDGEKLNAKYLFELLSYKKDEFLVPLMAGATNVTMKPQDIEKIRIPVPSIEIQLEVVRNASINRIRCQAESLKIAFETQLHDEFAVKEIRKLDELLRDLSYEEKKCQNVSDIWPNK